MATKTFAAGDVLTASDVNTYLSHEGGAWTSWTPTYTNFTIGNGTTVAKYARAGRIIHFKLKCTLGSTSSVTGAIRFTLPVTAAVVDDLEMFNVMFYDASLYRHGGITSSVSTTTCQLQVWDTSGATAFQINTSSTVPFTWTSTDLFYVTGTYEAASG